MTNEHRYSKTVFNNLNQCELQQIHAADFASEAFLTVGISIRVTCKLFEFIGFLFSGHVTFQIWS